jgi:hypothetical protein
MKEVSINKRFIQNVRSSWWIESSISSSTSSEWERENEESIQSQDNPAPYEGLWWEHSMSLKRIKKFTRKYESSTSSQGEPYFHKLREEILARISVSDERGVENIWLREKVTCHFTRVSPVNVPQVGNLASYLIELDRPFPRVELWHWETFELRAIQKHTIPSSLVIQWKILETGWSNLKFWLW